MMAFNSCPAAAVKPVPATLPLPSSAASLRPSGDELSRLRLRSGQGWSRPKAKAASVVTPGRFLPPNAQSLGAYEEEIAL